MSTFGDELIQSLNEALAHAKGEGPAIVHAPVARRHPDPATGREPPGCARSASKSPKPPTSTAARCPG